jgi:O-antigen/teichoic acid export membrane protein
VGSTGSQLTLIKNASANVIRGSASALVALALPPFLARFLSIEDFGVWILILQLSAYTSFLDFGIQTAIGRFVAYTTELGEKNRRDRIINTAFSFLLGSAVLGICLTILISWQMSNFFPKLPMSSLFNAQISLLLVGFSTAIGLPASVFSGIFIGFQRFEIPAAILGCGKLISGLLLILTVRHYKAVIPMAIVLACINLVTHFLQYFAYLKLNTETTFSLKLIDKKIGKELFDYCFSLSAWSLSMLLVVGMDTTLVGIFEFKALAYYGVAASLTTFITGLQSSIFNTLIPAAAVLNAQEDSKRLGKLLITTTRYGMFILLLTGLPLIAFTKVFLSNWLGISYVENTTILLQVLLAANIIRLSAIPYSTLLIGTGQQKIVLLSPLLEGFSNLFFSVIFGFKFGAVGVAGGTLIGAVVGILFHYFYNLKRTKLLELKQDTLLSDGVVKPLLCTLPLLVLVCFSFSPVFKSYFDTPMVLLSILGIPLTFFSIWNWGLLATEKKKVARIFDFIKTEK